MQRLRVRSSSFHYDVVVGRGAWTALKVLTRGRHTTKFLLTEESLWGRWGKEFVRASGLTDAQTVFVPAGEKSKSLRMVEQVAAALLDGGADRRSLLIAFGGGVVGDLGGFVASTYMRGIDYVQAPTTVVAQVDSAIGGKTAVNVGAMKNLIGTFYPPLQIVSEPRVLSTLSQRAFRSGLYEVVKHAILSGPGLFGELERRLARLWPSRAGAMGPLLARAAQVKVDVVTRDEREAGLRRVLNLGHTFGHAFEEATHYRRFLHGEAIGWGLHVAVRLAERLGILHAKEAERITRLVHNVGELPPICDLSCERVLALLPRDKKAVGGKIHWVLPRRIGKVLITADIPPTDVESALRDVQRAGRHE